MAINKNLNQIIEVGDYKIEIGQADLGLVPFLDSKQYSSVHVLVDQNTRHHCLPLLNDSLQEASIIEISAGEKHKNISTCTKIWRTMIESGADRKSLLVNLGGGVIGDMGGYVASCFMRGIDFIQIPTTLLSQVDASVGGKLGIDFDGLKNMIGVFKDPQKVLIDTRFLNTLPLRELRSGFAEVIKHALIKDKTSWQRLTSQSAWTDTNWPEEIMKSVQIKTEVVQSDPYENGERKTLNFGHTIGHAIESYSHYIKKPILHGEAIALGMVCEAHLSTKLCGLKEAEYTSIRNYILAIFDHVDYSLASHHDHILRIMISDKKNLAGRYKFALLDSIGDCRYDIDVRPEEVVNSLINLHK